MEQIKNRKFRDKSTVLLEVSKMKVFLAVLVLVNLKLAHLAAIDNGDDIPAFRHLTFEPLAEPETVLKPSFRIINGQEVTPHSIPYQVYLIGRVNSNLAWSCGGSLITATTVLTAAHCIDGARSIEVRLGGHNLRIRNEGQINVNASSWKRHEKYNSTIVINDIGVIRLPQSVPVSKVIGYARLPSRKDVGNTYVGVNSRVSGWGLTRGGGSSSVVLRAVNNTVITNKKCNETFGIVEDTELCLSGAQGRSACEGDSGGPLVAGTTQIGIVSYGTQGCLTNYPSAYVRITEYLNWIEANSDWRAS